MELRKASSGEVHKIINADYTGLYNKLSGSLGAGNPFAKFRIGNNFYIWSIPGEGWRQLLDVTPEIYGAAMSQLEDLRGSLVPKIGKTNADVILTFPDDSYLFYREGEGGKLEIAISGWGFKRPVMHVGDRQVEQIRRKNDISIAFEDDGERVANRQFGLHVGTQLKPMQTDEEGYARFNMNPGSMYKIVDTDTGKEFTLTVVEGVWYYPFDVTVPKPEPEPEPEPVVIPEPPMPEPPMPPVPEPPMPPEVPVNDVRVYLRDYQDRIPVCDHIVFKQQGAEDLTLIPDVDGKVTFAEDRFAKNVPLYAYIYRTADTSQPPVSMVLEEGVYDYLLKEELVNEKGTSLVNQILILCGIIALCALIWILFINFAGTTFTHFFN